MNHRWYWILYGFCWLALMEGLPRSWAQGGANAESYLLGIKAYQDGLWDLAIQQLDQYLSLYPEGPAAAQARFMQAEALFQKQQYRRAATLYHEFTQLYPHSELLDRVWYQLGVCSYRLGDYQAAEDAYQQLLDGLSPSLLRNKAQLGLAESLYAQAKYKLAQQSYQQIIKQSPPHTVGSNTVGSQPNRDLALYGLGLSSLKVGDYDQAVASLRQLTTKFPDSPVSSAAQSSLSQAYYGQGDSLYKQGQYRPALGSYQHLLRDYPKSYLVPAATYKLGLCYLGLNQPTKGAAVFERLIAKYPKHGLAQAAWLQLGELRFERKDYTAAAQAYTEATRSPDQQLAAEARYWLGECLAHQGQLDQALAEFLRLSRQYPDQVQWVNLARYQAGQIYLRQQKELAAKKLFLKVVQEATDTQLVQLAKERLQQLLNVSGGQEK